MTSKLEAIRERLRAYEAAKEAWRADKQNTHEVTEVYIEARDWMEGNAPDDLRALLAVVDAAAAIDLQEVINLSSEPVHMEQLATLQAAVDKLTEG